MYALRYEHRVEKELRPIPSRDRLQILHDIERLQDQPRRHGVEKLGGVDGYRLRVGDYRILFTIDDGSKRVTIYRIKHRRDAYR